jgi:L-2,4-diaminobutyrate decarboxylase
VIQVLTSIETTQQDADGFAALAKAHCAHLRATKGAVRVEILQAQDSPSHFTLIEVFTTQAELDAYHASRAYQSWYQAAGPMAVRWDSHVCRDLATSDPSETDASKHAFRPSKEALLAGVLPVLDRPDASEATDLPMHLPETGIGAAQALDRLAPLILGKARHLDGMASFDHMDPPTPWVTWVTTLWNASLNQNLLHPDTAPVARDIETRVIDWLAPLFGMEGGHMTPGSTVSNLTALWAARECAVVRRVLSSEAAHLSVGKAAYILGLKHEKIPTDARGALDISALPADLSDAALVLTAGATSTGAVDPLDAQIKAGWVHVDAAWAGPLVLSDRHRACLSGIEAADSVAISAHKWLFQPKESAMVLFKDAKTATDAVSFGGAYLAVPNVGVLGSAGARAVPLLAALLSWGRTGFAQQIDQAMQTADQLYEHLNTDPRVMVFSPPQTGVMLWRPVSGTAQDVKAKLPTGTASVTHVDGHDWLRQVAANPMADANAVYAEIDAVLEQG